MSRPITLEDLALEDYLRRLTRNQAKINTRRRKGKV